jgi:2-oxoisovalerate dehydrogenase E1 component
LLLFWGEWFVAANGFWAALNIVTTLWYPYLFFIEDNQYGLSVPSLCQTPGGDIAANLSSYENLKTMDADGTDPVEAWRSIQDAVNFIRTEGGPCLLRVRIPRLMGHTFVDTQTYKSQEQLQDEASRDPLPKLREFLVDQALKTPMAISRKQDRCRAGTGFGSAPRPRACSGICVEHVFIQVSARMRAD